MTLAAVLVALLGFAVTEWWVRNSVSDIETRLQDQFETLSRRVENDVDARFSRALAPLRSVRSYLMASDDVDYREFRTYVTTRDVATEFPGIRGVGLIERVPSAKLAKFEAEQRRRGLLGFEINTSGTHEEHYVIKYIEPLYRNLAEQGFDIASETRRKRAADAAATSGQPTLTAPITLLQDSKSGAGFLYLLPWYGGSEPAPNTLELRQTLLRGWVYVPIVVSELMAGSQIDLGDQLHFSLYFLRSDGEEQWLYSSNGNAAESSNSRYRMDSDVALGGQILRLHTFSTPEFELAIGPMLVVQKRVLGYALSFLLAAVAWLLLGARLRALSLARKMTRDLDRLATVARHTTNAVIFTDLQERIVWANEGFTRISGFSFEEARGKVPGRFLQSERTDPQARQAIRRAIEQRVSCRQLILNTHKNGTDYWLDLEIQPLRDESGEVTGFVALESDVTKDIESKLALERSQAIFRGSMDAINEAYVLFDPQDRLVYCNQKYLDLYARSADLIVPGASFESIIRGGAERGQYKDAVGRIEEWVRKRMAAHLAGDVTLEQQLDDGRWLRIVERKMSDGHIVGFRVDITELKQATLDAQVTSAALSRQQEQLQSILEGTNVGTWLWNVQTGECQFNERWAEMLGYSLDELQPSNIEVWRSLLQPDDLERCSFLLQEHFTRQSDFYEAEVPMLHKDGHWVWVLTRGKVSAWTEDGEPLRMAGTHADVSARKAAELKLAETSTTLQNVLDSAVEVGVIATDLQRVVRVFNKGAENLLHYRASELIGQRTSSMFFDLAQLGVVGETLELRLGRKPTSDEIFWEVANTKGQSEWTMVRKDGSRFAASLVFSPMQGPGGQLVGFLGIVYDITRQKETEASLRDAMRLAEQSSVAKSQFLANMSHEIRTPMNAILGMLQLLHSTALSARQRDYTGKAEGAAKALLGLLNDILDFSKVDAGKMQLDPQEFDVSNLLADLSVILSSNLGRKPVDLVFDLDPALPPRLVGDALRLKQILINLAGNAVKFTEAGQVTIGLRQLSRSAGSVHLEVWVEDTGIGIAPENQGRIFQAFTQAEASTTRRFGGTGLGLVISTRLIRLMGGELGLRSTPGEGSTFSFEVTLPIAATTPLLAPAHDQKPPCRVLLVDDNVRALESLARMLTAIGWEVVTASSGDSAVQRVKQLHESGKPPLDALIVDQDMPSMNGWETLRAIVRVYGRSASPLRILMSNQNLESLVQYSGREQDWLDGFLVKPLTAATVAQAVLHRSAVHEDQTESQGSRPSNLQRLAGMRILVVEDNLINQQVAQELLQGQGAAVTLAPDGQEGLNALAAAEPVFDAVLMDLQMPVMDGLTATRALRQNPVWRSLPVIAMTANAMASDREACLQAGMNDHVGKPFDLDHLVTILVNLTQWKTPVDRAAEVSPVVPMTSVHDEWPAGVDVQAALQRMGGNRGLLARSIRSFVQESRGWLGRSKAKVSENAWPELARDLHALKGLSATIGVDALRHAAAQAEQQVKSQNALPSSPVLMEVEELLQRVDALMLQMTPILGDLADQLDGGASPVHDAGAGGFAHRAALSPDQIETLQTLLGMLRSSDMVAMELHAELGEVIRDALGSRMDPLDAAMAELDFAQAAVECAALIDSA